MKKSKGIDKKRDDKIQLEIIHNKYKAMKLLLESSSGQYMPLVGLGFVQAITRIQEAQPKAKIIVSPVAIDSHVNITKFDNAKKGKELQDFYESLGAYNSVEAAFEWVKDNPKKLVFAVIHESELRKPCIQKLIAKKEPYINVVVIHFQYDFDIETGANFAVDNPFWGRLYEVFAAGFPTLKNGVKYVDKQITKSLAQTWLENQFIKDIKELKLKPFKK